MKGRRFLKVTSVLMLVFGIIALVLGLVGTVTVALYSAFMEQSVGAFYVSAALLLVACVIEIVAGIKGNTASRVPQAASGCVPWGIAVLVLTVLSLVLGVVADRGIDWWSVVLNLLVPALYVYGAVTLARSAAQAPAGKE